MVTVNKNIGIGKVTLPVSHVTNDIIKNWVQEVKEMKVNEAHIWNKTS